MLLPNNKIHRLNQTGFDEMFSDCAGFLAYFLYFEKGK
jgi:hypothetical protein